MKTTQLFTSVRSFIRSQFRGDGKGPRPLGIALIIAASLLAAVLFGFLFTLLIQWLWGWLVPDLFPSAVREGSLAGEISRGTAFKILVALVIVGSLFRGNSSRTERAREKPQPVAAAAETAAATAPSGPVFPALVDPLTDRELEVLQLLGKGLTNQQIAVQLSVSESTVVYHIGHIFGKLRVTSRVEAAVWAKEHGII